jgi:hypothetical protein
MGHVSRYSGLHRREASLVRVFQSGLNTSGGTTTSGVRDIITEVASS